MKRIMMALLVVLAATSGCKKDTPTPETGPLVYTVTASQSFTNPPEMIIHENTIGNIQWKYVSEGVYHGVLPGAFPLGKTFTICDNGVDGYVSADLGHWDSDFIEYRTYAGLHELGVPDPHNGVAGINFEIRVYP